MFKLISRTFLILWVIGLMQLCNVTALALQKQKQGPGNPKIDSLVATIPTLMRSDIVKAQRNIDEIRRLSVLQNYKPGIVEAAFDDCWMQYHEGHMARCIAMLDSVLKNTPDIYQAPTVIKFHILKGQCYVKQTQLSLAVAQFSTALKLSEKFKDDGNKAGALLSIGWAYMEHNKFNDAIGFFLELLKIKASNNYLNKATVFNNIASCYNSLAKYKEAANYAQQGIKEARQTNSLADLANGLNILAGADYQLGNTQQALNTLNQASKVREKIGDPAMLAADYIELSDMYRKSGQYKQAVAYAQKAADISAKNKIDLKLIDAYNALANSLEGTGDYKQAAVYYKKLLGYKDSTSAAANNQAMADLLVKYNTEKKTTENLQLKQDNLNARLNLATKQRWLTLSIALVLLIVVIAIFSYLYTRNRYKTRLALQQVTGQKNRMLAVLQTEETERRRIAGDLHDGVCQMLAAIAIQLKNPKHSIEVLQQLLEQATNEVRTVSHQMTPELLKHYGLVKAIESSLQRLNNADTGTTYNFFEMVEVDGIDELLQVIIYRASQELINNINKHAQATEVNVHLTINDEHILLLIEDNGVGFDTNSTNNGLGLKSLAGRVKVFNGLLTIDSTPQKGTTVIIKFNEPLLIQHP